MNTKTKKTKRKVSLTKEELRKFKGFEDCTDRELEKEIEHINTLSRVLYNFMTKTVEL